ncbi:MAG TPA: cyclic nucleotide-binding domain-containing protein [Thermoanaerobaculia bacterium]|nr:cyclic nucleotide-binding domain-containing protein [Thermoanaerobaculia bacterium]
MPDQLGKIFAPGETIVRQGERGSEMFVLQRGRVEIVQRSANGEEVRLGVLGPGEVFGEMAIFERHVRSATARAVDEAAVLTVDRRTFLRRVQEDPSIALHILRSMSQRVRQLSGELTVLRSCLAAQVDGPREPAA